MAKGNRLYLYGGLALVVVAALILTEPQKVQRPPRKSAAVTRPVKTDKALEDFDERDQKATFEPVALTTRDAFKPLVVRGEGVGPDSAGLPNQVPPSFASGEAGWFFTGAAVIDQVPTALIENTQTGQGLYVKQGDLWKNCRVERITPTSLTLAAGDSVRTLMLLADVPQPEPSGGSTRPLNPLTGPVGVQSRPNPLPGNVPAQPNNGQVNGGRPTDPRRSGRRGNGQPAEPFGPQGGPQGEPGPFDEFDLNIPTHDDQNLKHEANL